MQENPNRLLIVDDEEQICAVVVTVAEQVGFAAKRGLRQYGEFRIY